MGSLAQTQGRGIIGVPTQPQEYGDWFRNVANVINLSILQGKLNCSGSATLTNGATATTISDARVAATSVIVPMATTANAAAALTTWHVTAASLIEGSFVLNHVSTSTSDCVIFYAILG